MKTKILSMSFGALAIIMAACSTDLTPEPDSPSDKGESILRLDIQKQDLTRGIITSTSFEKGDSVFVVVRDKEHPDPLTFTSLAVYDGKEWILQDKIDLSAETSGIAWTTANVEVYYPYDTFSQVYDPHNSTQFIIANPLDQQDLLYGWANGVNQENPTAKVTCNHLKTRLTFELKNNSDYPVGISKISVTTEGEQLFIGRYGYINGGYFYIPDEYFSDYSIPTNIQIAAGETTNLDILIPPTEQAYEMMIQKILNDGASKTVLKFTLEGYNTINFDIDAAAWAPGEQYIYPVTLFYERKPIPDTDEYADLGLSVLWAKYNVCAEKPEDIGKYFFWGDTRGYEIGESYTQSTCSFVNNKTAEQLLASKIVVEDPNRPLVDRYKYCLAPEYDAATQNMGSPWRMPTAEEIHEFRENTKMEWYMEEGDWMFKFTSTVPGYEDRYIIMPGQIGCFYGYPTEIKYLDSFRNMSNPAGEWWGSTLSDDKERAYGFSIVWGEGDPVKYDNPRNSVTGSFRTWGYPVRAVRPLRVK